MDIISYHGGHEKFDSGDIITMEVDMEAHTLKFFKNQSQDPAVVISSGITGKMYMTSSMYGHGSTLTLLSHTTF